MTFFVYALYRPWNDVICYVGKGSGRRHLEHEGMGERHENPHLAAIFTRAQRLGLRVEAIILREGLMEQEAFATEAALIAQFGRADLRQGPLANHSDGGEGNAGHTWSPDQKARHSEKLREVANRPDLKAIRVRTLAASKAAAHAAREAKFNQLDEKAKRAERARKTCLDPKVREKMRLGIIAAHQRPDVKLKHKKGLIRGWANRS